MGSGGLHRAVGADSRFKGDRGYFWAVSKILAGQKMEGLTKILYFSPFSFISIGILLRTFLI